MAKKIPLRELCSIEITDGTHKTPTYSEEGYIFLSSKNVTTGKINWKDVMYIPEELHNELYKRIAPQKDDILLAKNGTTGVAAIVDRNEIFDIYVSLALIRPNKEKVLPRYLLHAINSEPSKKFFNEHLKGIGVPNLHLTHIRETPISILDFSKQKEIVEKLDKVDELISCRKKQLSKLDELVKARFVEMFGNPVKNDMGWESKPLNEVCDGIGDGLHGTPVYDDNGEYPFINGNNLIDGKIVITSSTKTVSEETYKKHFIDISTNAILISINGTLGKLAFYNGEKVMLGKSACYCNLKKNINKVFVYGIMKSDSFAEFLENSSTKSTIKNVGLKAMREYKLILPPTELQNQFAAFVEQTEKTKAEVQKSLDELEILKKSLMQKYFG